MSFGSLVLVLNVGSTLFMTGLIWLVQIAHYPSFKNVGPEVFQSFHAAHTVRTKKVVAVPMIVELATSVLLVWLPPIPNGALLLLSVGLLFVIWVSTFLLQIPCHEELAKGFDPKVHRQLILTNWIRTICWTLRGILVCTFVVGAIAKASIS